MIPKRVLVNLEKCGSDSTWISRRPTVANAPSTAMVMCPCLAPARYTTGMNSAHMTIDMSRAHLGGGCGSSDGMVSIIWKYSLADSVAVSVMTMAHIQPPKMMAPRPAIASVTPEAIRSWSLPMDTLGLTMPESDEPASAAAASARTRRVRFGSHERLASSAPPAPFTAATRSPPRAPPQTCRGPSPVRPCPSLAPWRFTFASGAPPETGVRLATPRDRDAAGTTTPAVAACSMATISREFVSALVR
mmetsp:Transcript_11155/g.48199  ORF Transcript_11155/g.48199 Transcript_11155/m.48199 type:complete len:247 (-) Transcript_11155:136-876(-)